MKTSFTKSQLKKVGEKLRHHVPLSPKEELILAEFRLGHRSIIEAFRNHHKTLLDRSKWKERGILFVSRLKKRNTLVNKLADRQRQMDISRMHDIAGCRLIFLNLKHLLSYRNRFVQRVISTKHYVHLRADNYNYLIHPRDTGYRGIHDVYEEELPGDQLKAKIEIQYRTITQHAWSTALEIWDQSHLCGAKFGLEDKGIQELFMLYAELLWRFNDFDPDSGQFKREHVDLDDGDLYHRIRKQERELHVLRYLRDLKRVKAKIAIKGEDVLLHRYTRISGGGSTTALEARQLTWDAVQSELFEKELDETNDFVFVQASSRVLRRAYNNYFDDAGGFVSKVCVAMKRLHGCRSFMSFRRDLDPVFVLHK